VTDEQRQRWARQGLARYARRRHRCATCRLAIRPDDRLWGNRRIGWCCCAACELEAQRQHDLARECWAGQRPARQRRRVERCEPQAEQLALFA
jgi:hypothetical protein